MKKMLFVATVSRHFYLFEQANIEVLRDLGYEIHGAANFSDSNERLDTLDIIQHPLDIQRSPFSLKNIKAYEQLKKIMKSENFDAVHCHTPVGGVLARLVAKSVGVKKVIYTAHGFHFYKGAPIFNWLTCFCIEKWLSKYTDVLIAINKEDYLLAQRKMKAKRVEYVPGVGIDVEKYCNCKIDKRKKREDLGVPDGAFVILSVGELNRNKNHRLVIEAIAQLRIKNIRYIICGQGPLDQKLKDLAEKRGIGQRVLFLGFRTDIPELLKAADLFAFPSFREGLPVSLMEAMASGLPVVYSDIRGNNDLIMNGIGGYAINPKSILQVSRQIMELYKDKTKRAVLGEYNRRNIRKFGIEVVSKIMSEIYRTERKL